MGNIDVLRDWAMQRTMSDALDDASTGKPEDYVIATGK